MSDDVARKVLAEALLLDERDIDENTRLGDTSEWDSVAHVRLIDLVESHIGAPLTPLAIVSIESLADVESALAGEI